MSRFRDKDAEVLWKGEWISKYQSIKKVAYKKLHSVINASNLNDLYLIPGNRTEELRGRKDYYSIRINNQYRIIFKWDKRSIERTSNLVLNQNSGDKLTLLNNKELLKEVKRRLKEDKIS